MVSSAGPWHPKTPKETLHHHQTTIEAGLDSEDVRKRAAVHGANVIEKGTRRGPFRILLSQFSDLMVIVLLGAAVIAGFLGEPEDIIAIVIIVALNAVLGFIQEYRAERAMEALQQLAAPQARVRRQGKTIQIPAFELVPGDVVILEAGSLVPADVRVIEAFQLKIDESTLTGESSPVEKITEAIEIQDLPVADQRNMAFKGTSISAGRGTGIVVGTGMSTELGKIAKLLQEEVVAKTPLQARLARFARRLALIVIGLCVVIFYAGVVRGEPPLLMLMTALSMAVAAIPEALPAVVTVSLSLGARAMASRNSLIRKLPAVEALGSVTFICSDKTGTLTENKMTVQSYFLDGTLANYPPELKARNHSWQLLLRILAQSNDAILLESGELQGDPTEVALYRAAEQAGVLKADLEKAAPRIAEVPFTSERGMMTTVHRVAGRVFVYTKGAPEKLFSICRFKGGPQEAEQVRSAVLRMAEQGLRVLAFATKEFSSDASCTDVGELERELTFVGLVGMMDPPRAEAQGAVKLCQSAGIHVVMITGDHPSTAQSIARQLGILNFDRSQVITGGELSQLPDEELTKRIRLIAVYARVAPEQKIRIVKSLQAAGEIVAMTGDGVNDAPALRRADIGVAMGRGGTDVAREAAHMVLLDDNFATIVASVRAGRRIYDNIRKFVKFALAGNAGEILSLFIAPFIGLQLPLLPIQILWVNLVTDGLPGLALAVEPEEIDLMKRSPRHPKESVFAHGLWQHAIWAGILIAAVTLGTQALALRVGSANWQSMAFTVLTLTQMGHVLAVKSESQSWFTQGIASNRALHGAVLFTLLLQGAALYIPAMNRLLKTVPLAPWELLVCLAFSTIVFAAVEVEKLLRRKRLLYRK